MEITTARHTKLYFLMLSLFNDRHLRFNKAKITAHQKWYSKSVIFGIYAYAYK